MFALLRKLFGRKTAGSGAAGERLAADFLRRQRGFEVIARNWRSPRDRRDEIDLVCRDGEVLVFVEVKTRSARALVPGVYAVDRRKKRVIERAARIYLSQLPQRPRTFRFDVVEVATPVAGSTEASAAREPQVLHFENVPLFPKHFR